MPAGDRADDRHVRADGPHGDHRARHGRGDGSWVSSRSGSARGWRRRRPRASTRAVRSSLTARVSLTAEAGHGRHRDRQRRGLQAWGGLPRVEGCVLTRRQLASPTTSLTAVAAALRGVIEADRFRHAPRLDRFGRRWGDWRRRRRRLQGEPRQPRRRRGPNGGRAGEDAAPLAKRSRPPANNRVAMGGAKPADWQLKAGGPLRSPAVSFHRTGMSPGHTHAQRKQTGTDPSRVDHRRRLHRRLDGFPAGPP